VSNLDDAKRRGKKPRSKTQKIGECDDSGKSGKQGLSPALQGHIGRQLRAMFDGVAHEPVPDRFLQLLKDLEQSGDK
jgi:anti-sigma factor NepR-like protein